MTFFYFPKKLDINILRSHEFRSTTHQNMKEGIIYEIQSYIAKRLGKIKIIKSKKQICKNTSSKLFLRFQKILVITVQCIGFYHYIHESWYLPRSKVNLYNNYFRFNSTLENDIFFHIVSIN